VNIEWEKLGQFVQNVGVPFAVLILFVGPFVYLCFTFVKKYGSQITEAHIKFIDSCERTQEQNAETLQRLESTIAEKHFDHQSTHKAIGLVAQAGVAMLDDKKHEARTKLSQVDEVLYRQSGRGQL
jgi:hypothetical protein